MGEKCLGGTEYPLMKRHHLSHYLLVAVGQYGIMCNLD